ncbi:MAG: tetratricopeptide repeat protein [Bdellovibrionales bacterium]|nr:tetratricopeptide repeat protein [Bdellovibrionales bacterium]
MTTIVKILKRTIGLFVVLTLSSCQYSFLNIEYQRGESAARSEEFLDAVGFYKRVIQRAPESDLSIDAAKKAARISVLQLKKYQDAVDFYQHIVVYGKNDADRKGAQKQIASIYYDKLANYQKAIEAYSKLLALPHSHQETIYYSMRISHSFFYLGDYTQAKVEINKLLKSQLEEEQEFQAQLFLGNIYFTTKEMTEAIRVFTGLVEKFPERSREEKVPMTIVVCYEELKDYDMAISKLKEMKLTNESSDQIELKIRRLEKRKANLPGYRGLRK